MNVINEIVLRKKERIKEQKVSLPLKEIKVMALDKTVKRDFLYKIKRTSQNKINYIGELKKASPSEGVLREDFNHIDIAHIYEHKGASAISVITEEDYFQGNINFLKEVSERVKIPVLRKDFIFDDYQVYESLVNGADAILLIAAILSRTQADEMYHLACELGLHVVFEVHHWKELDNVLLIDPPIIGINNRDLKTLKVNINHTLELFKDIPKDKIIIGMSGIKSRKDVEFFEKTTIDALLIGSVFMKAKSIEEKIKEFFPEYNT